MSGKYIYNFARRNSTGQSLYKTEGAARERAQHDHSRNLASPLYIELLGEGIIVDYRKTSSWSNLITSDLQSNLKHLSDLVEEEKNE